MHKPDKDKFHVHAYVDTGTWVILNEYCKEQERSIAWVIRTALREFLDREVR